MLISGRVTRHANIPLELLGDTLHEYQLNRVNALRFRSDSGSMTWDPPSLSLLSFNMRGHQITERYTAQVESFNGKAAKEIRYNRNQLLSCP
jgi:hypothetical protein